MDHPREGNPEPRAGNPLARAGLEALGSGRRLGQGDLARGNLGQGSTRGLEEAGSWKHRHSGHIGLEGTTPRNLVSDLINRGRIDIEEGWFAGGSFPSRERHLDAGHDGREM
ncbi:MAG: hypothetical protein ACK5F7_13320 [Planctomycetaceae bacterium]